MSELIIIFQAVVCAVLVIVIVEQRRLIKHFIGKRKTRKTLEEEIKTSEQRTIARIRQMGRR